MPCACPRLISDNPPGLRAPNSKLGPGESIRVRSGGLLLAEPLPVGFTQDRGAKKATSGADGVVVPLHSFRALRHQSQAAAEALFRWDDAVQLILWLVGAASLDFLVRGLDGPR